jgi:hypothetical protein
VSLLPKERKGLAVFNMTIGHSFVDHILCRQLECDQLDTACRWTFFGVYSGRLGEQSMANHGRACVFPLVLGLTWMGILGRAADDSELREDCLAFNLDSASVALVRGSWKIIDGSQWMFDFGNQEQQARHALGIIHYYRMDSTCFAGRPHPPMIYLLASGRAPEGSMPGEQCEPFDATRISLSQYDAEFWRILSGGQVLFDFGNREGGARQELLALSHYRFNYQCIVGSTGSSFRYLRR